MATAKYFAESEIHIPVVLSVGFRVFFRCSTHLRYSQLREIRLFADNKSSWGVSFRKELRCCIGGEVVLSTKLISKCKNMKHIFWTADERSNRRKILAVTTQLKQLRREVEVA